MASPKIIIKYILLTILITVLSACGNAELANSKPENATPLNTQEEVAETVGSEDSTAETEVLEAPSEPSEEKTKVEDNASEEAELSQEKDTAVKTEPAAVNEDPEPVLPAEEPLKEASSEETEEIPEEITEEISTEENEAMKNETVELKLSIGGTVVDVSWEENESVAALKDLAPLTINMSMYGGFEQVGSIGSSLPRNDQQITTNAGDIVLYSGNQIVVFYGSNSWAYTRLGHITDRSAEEMAALLGNGDVTITISK